MNTLKSEKLLSLAGTVHYNLTVAELVERALARGEGKIAANGAIRVVTGKYTGRSPNDKFVVENASDKDEVDWENNKAFSPENYIKIYNRMMAYIQDKEIFVFDGIAGADPNHKLNVRFINEFAWQNLFVHQLFVRPNGEPQEPQFRLICLPGFKGIPEIDGINSEAFIVLNFAEKTVLIGGSHYAGEMKKSIFTVMNYLLPAKGIMSMHCSANVGERGDTALFFGLSGTGKTTLSADPNRRLIGDDEHGWTDDGVFNVEGGCYAKCIRLSKENEPQIWNALRFGSVLENVVMDEQTREVDYDSDAITENTRGAYPVDYIPNVVIEGKAGHPKTIIFLTADAFGVLPPISKLNKEQAIYHFLSGYTSKLAGTERGIVEPETTFSTCFGAPFLPRSPLTYAKLLGEKIEKHNTNVFLINTGWTGGAYGVGKRMSIPHTRAMITAAIEDLLCDTKFELDSIFNVYVPTSCPNVPSDVLNPRNTWSDKEAYDRQARDLAQRFVKNFNKFSKNMPPEIIAAGPKP